MIILNKLCKLYYKPLSILSSFSSFKLTYIDKLEYIDDNMLKIYEIAFFVFLYPQEKEIVKKEKINNKIFIKALKEVKENIKIEEKKEERIEVGLYKIL